MYPEPGTYVELAPTRATIFSSWEQQFRTLYVLTPRVTRRGALTPLVLVTLLLPIFFFFMPFALARSTRFCCARFDCIYIYIYTVYRTYPRLSFFELYLTRLLKYRYTVPFKTSRDELLKIRQRERGARRRNKHFASVRREKLYSVEYRNLPSYSTFVAIYLS